jgi:TolA-binding protein
VVGGGDSKGVIVLARRSVREQLKNLSGLKALGIAGLLGALAVGAVALEGRKQELAAKGLGPILPLAASLGETPFQNEMLRDPGVLQQMPGSSDDASRLAAEIKEWRSDLARSKGERALELNENAYLGYAALSYYLEDALSGRTGEKIDAARTVTDLAAIRRFLIQHADTVARSTKNAAQMARAQYHVNAALYASGTTRAKAAGELKKLADGKLSGALKNRARLAAAAWDVDHGGGAERAKALTVLRGLAKSLPGDAQIGARLVTARALAGLAANGRRRDNADAGYRQQLSMVSQRVAGLSPAQREAVLRYSIAVWRGAEGGAWDNAPFKMSAYADQIAAKGIIERSALDAWSKGQRPLAIKKYEGIARSLTGTPTRAAVDLRILELRRADGVASRSQSGYERALLAMQKQYLDPGLLGEGNEAKAKAMSAEIARRHETLVQSEIARAANRSAAPRERLAAIGMADRFLATIDDNKRIEGIRAQIAGLYALNGQHAEAVGIYKELAETGTSGQGHRYFGLAIESQRVLAQWPAEAPWNGYKAGFAAEREELLTLYGKFIDTGAKGLDWSLAAHVGLLQVSLGHPDQAFTAWTAALKQEPRGAHAAAAAGYMLTAYSKASTWASLEQIARLCIAQRIVPTFKGSPVAVGDMLALALLEGGKEAMDAGKFKVAVAKLKEFVAKFPSAKRHDEGFFLLASAYRGAGQHKQSIETLLAFVDRYPRSAYYRQALLNGGDWSAPLAFEDNAMFFYARFANAYGGDAEAPRVRELLTELYLGRGMYAEAAYTLDLTVKAQNVDAATKSAALARVMEIEERQGSLERAHKAADLLIRASDAGEEAKAEAYALKARQAARAGDYQGLQRIEAQVAALGGNGAAAQEVVGETRYYMAALVGRDVVKKYYNLELTDPLQTLDKRYGGFVNARNAFQRVCEAGQTSYCVPALNQLARLAEDFMKSIEDIEIQDTLAKPVVDRFQTRKREIFADVSASSQKSDARAVAVVGEGYTDPDSAQAVLWQNTSDWNFERVSGETGNAYVQWALPEASAASTDE